MIPKNILVTGKNGFIGSHVSDAWRGFGHHVTGLVRNTKSGSTLPDISCDLAKHVPEIGTPDIIVHAAATSPGRSKTPGSMVRDNVTGTLNIVESAVRAGTPEFIHLSSLSVYEASGDAIIDEQTSPCARGIYGLSKLLSDTIVAETGPPRSIILRLPGILGAGAEYPWLVQTARRLLRNEPVEIHNPGKRFNAMLHMKNLSEFLTHLLQHIWTGKPVVPLGCRDAMSITDTVHFLKTRLGSSSNITVRKAESPVPLVDVRAAEALGFVPYTAEQTLACLADDLVKK